jgi:hypothetical protein
MSNAFYTTSKVLNEGLMILENELVAGNKISVDYADEYGAFGDTINIRRPTQYIGQDNNLDISSYNEDIQQGTVPITLDQTATVAVKITAKERTLSFDRFSEDVIKPAMVTMKDKIETHIASLYPKFYHFTGTPGTVPATFKALGGMGSVLTDGAVPQSGRIALHGTDATLELADGLKGVFVQGIAKTAIEMAEFGRYAGFTNYEWVHAPAHTVGALGGTPKINGASQNVTYAASKQTWSQTLVTKGWANSVTGVVKAGDVFTIPGVYAVNPVSRVSTGRLQTFTILADADSGASTGPATLTISPPIIISGAYQTVSAAPADDVAITMKTGTAATTYKQSLLMHPRAMTLVSRALDIPKNNGVNTSTKSGNRVTVSVTEFVDGKTLDQTMRFDMLYKAVVIDPRLGGRLTS